MAVVIGWQTKTHLYNTGSLWQDRASNPAFVGFRVQQVYLSHPVPFPAPMLYQPFSSRLPFERRTVSEETVLSRIPRSLNAADPTKQI